MLVQHLLDQRADLVRYLLCPAAGAENQRVAGLDRDQRLENKRRHRMRRRHQPDDNTDWAGDLGDLALGIKADDTMPDPPGQLRIRFKAGDPVLEGLVTYVAHTGLGDGRDR